ncbi:MAG: FIST C-terminal domain-containing protein [Methylophilaceae bacterium]
MKKIATGLAYGSIAKPELAAKAVKNAMTKAAIKSPSAVLLFLTSEFASDPQSAIKAAAKAAGCTQVIGCSATGIFTEEDWILDSPAAAAMVFSDSASLSVMLKETNTPLLTIAAPNAINSTWLNKSRLRFGGVSGDATGHGPFSVWENGKGATQGYCEVAVNNAQIAIAASHGLKSISSPKIITKTNSHDLLSIDNNDALSNLIQACGNKSESSQELPYHQIVAMYADTPEAFARDEHNVASIITSNEKSGAITLSKSLQKGDFLNWAIRDVNAAQVDIVKTASKLKQQLSSEPTFALLFSCLGRGPSFYNGSDQDLELLKTLFPDLPMIGFYGNGEIAPILGKNELLQYSAVLGLFAEKNNVSENAGV